VLTCTYDAYKAFSTISNKTIRIKIKSSISTTIQIRHPTDTTIKTQSLVAGEWNIIDATVGATSSGYLIIIAGSVSAVLDIDWIYIGTGAYLPGSVLDNSGHGNHGQAFSVTPVAGISGNGLSFNGVNSYVKLPTFNSFPGLNGADTNGLNAPKLIMASGPIKTGIPASANSFQYLEWSVEMFM